MPSRHRSIAGRSLACRRLLAVPSIVSWLAACGTVPDVNPIIAAAEMAVPAPQLVGPRGPLRPDESRAVLDRLRRENGEADVLQRHLALEQALAGSPLVTGNKVRLLHDGEAAFRAIFKLIAEARDHVHLEYFTVEDVEQDGKRLGDLLVEKRRAGLAVNVIYDSYGSKDTPTAFFDQLRQGGVQVVDFHPLNPLKAGSDYRPNHRDHRKILVVDGRIGVVGGVNLSRVYQPPHDAQAELWRDADLAIEGPVVAELQKLFLQTWTEAGGPAPGGTPYPPVAAHGDDLIRILGSTPDEAVPHYYVTFLTALRNAERRVLATTGYFVPTDQELDDLIAAAGRGVEITLVLPGRSDSDLSLLVGRSHYTDLLDAGVRIHETGDAILHAKMVTIDGVWSAMGSSNLDFRSVALNNEVDAVVLGRDTAAQLEALFLEDLRHARAIDRATWDQRPAWDRLAETAARLWQWML